MSSKLVVIDGPEAGRSIILEAGASLLVGRGQASNTRLNDPRISRVHCKFEVGQGETVLTDVGSTGGTFVGGRKITTHRLAHGDEIQIGESRLRFESDTTPEHGAQINSPPRMSGQAIQQLVGQTLGHFKLECIAHVGETSILFRGQDQTHSRPAMIKVMLPTVMSNEEERHRFVRAVHTMINIKHENLVEVYGAGKQGPFCWCAMEYVDGVSILEIIEMLGVQGRLDWREVFPVAVHVAQALDCAYRHKVIHRNVTPDNLIRRKNDQVVKLCDLMLAKALEGTQARQVTSPGQIVGNIAYMSPERIVDTSSLDWRSDQYSLGATLFALLTGHPPFTGSSLIEIVTAIRNDTPMVPDEVRRETSPEFLQIVLEMLSKNPDDRIHYPSKLTDRLHAIGKQYDVHAGVVFDR